MPKICIDADGCPVVNETIVVAQDLGINVVIFCDTSHEIVREGAMTVTVSKGNDSADFALVNRIQKGDIVVTQDYGLATMVLAKNGFCIDQNGREYTHQNIDSLLNIRHVSKKIRQNGGRLKGPKKRAKDANKIYEIKFRQFCERILYIDKRD